MNIGELTATLGIDAKRFDDGIKRSTSGLMNFKRLIGTVSVVALAYKLNSMTREWESLYHVEEQANAGLKQAMISMGRYTDAAYKSMLDYAAALQRSTTFGDEAIKTGAKMLMTYKGISDDVMPRVIKAMADLSALTGRDMVASANLLGKASMGLVGELRRVGITVDELMFKEKGFLGVLEQIEDQVSGQAEALARTKSGGMEQYANIVGDLKERLGEITLTMKAEFVPVLLDIVEGTSQWIERQKEFQKMGVPNWLDNMKNGLQDIRDIMKDIVSILSLIDLELLREVAGYWEWIVGALVGAHFGGPPGAMIGTAIGAVVSMWRDWRHEQQKTQQAMNEIMGPPIPTGYKIPESPQVPDILDDTKQLAEQAEERQRMIEEFMDNYRQATMSAADYALYQLNKERDEYAQFVKDKSMLDAWYYAERAKISSRYAEEELQTDADMMGAKMQIYETNLRAKVDVLQSLLEFKAKVDVAEIEAATERIKAAHESVSVSLESSQRLLSDLFDTLIEAPASGKIRMMIEDQIREDSYMREESFEMQKALNEAQVRYFNAMAEKINRGDSTIKVSADGLKPHLESILWEILDACQVKVNHEYGEFLLGLGGAL